jgi:hypothetical protein
MVSLAGSLYSQNDENPIDLLDDSQFPTPHAIEDHLLGTAVDVAYEVTYEEVESDGKHRRRFRTDVRRRSYGPVEVENVKRYLQFLALYLTTEGTQDISWWRMRLPYQAGGRPRRLYLLVILAVNLVLLLIWRDWSAGRVGVVS